MQHKAGETSPQLADHRSFLSGSNLQLEAGVHYSASDTQYSCAQYSYDMQYSYYYSYVVRISAAQQYTPTLHLEHDQARPIS